MSNAADPRLHDNSSYTCSVKAGSLTQNSLGPHSIGPSLGAHRLEKSLRPNDDLSLGLLEMKTRPSGSKASASVHAQVRNQRTWVKYPSFLFIRIFRVVCFLKVEQNVSENNIHVGVGVDGTPEGE